MVTAVHHCGSVNLTLISYLFYLLIFQV